MSPPEVTDSPHLPARRSVREMMGLVLLALLPGIMASVALFGPGVVLQIGLATFFALVFEGLMLGMRGKPLQPFISDLSAPLTAVLFALCLPPLTPWWVAAIGMAAAIVVGKHLYGGLGHNLFNPAMVGVAVVLVCFPGEFTRWLPPAGLEQPFATPGLIDSMKAIFSGQLPPPWAWDTLAQATPLDTLRTSGAQGLMQDEIRQQPMFGNVGGKGWEWIAAFHALGGLFLLWKKIIPWQTPVAVLSATVAFSLPLWLFEPALHPSPLFHIFSGGLMLAAFFIATDPVTGCTTARGRLIFGFGIALLTLLIRRWGAYPDGIAFAVLLMNCAAPLIDGLTRARYLGEGAASD